MSKGDAENYLREEQKTYEGFNTWKQLYGGVDVGTQAAIEQQQYDYSGAMAQAYSTYRQGANALGASDYGQGFKAAALEADHNYLQEAYETYAKNFGTGLSAIVETQTKQVGEIGKALATEATNLELLDRSAYDYLAALQKHSKETGIFTGTKVIDPITGATMDKYEDIFATDDQFKKYMTQDPDGTARLKTREELMSEFVTTKQDPVTGESITELNVAGIDFYDRMLNQMTTEGRGLTYDAWLKEQSLDKSSDYYGAYEWATDQSLYDWDPKNQSNIGTFRKMVGLASDDMKYQFVERWGGLSAEETSKLFDTFKESADSISKLASEGGKTSADDIVKQATTSFSELRTYAKSLGIENELDKYLAQALTNMGIKTDSGWDGLDTLLTQYGAKAISKKDMAGDFFATTAKGLGAGAVAGAGVGALVGTVTVPIPVFGTAAGAMWGAVVGGFVGLDAAIVKGAIDVSNAKKGNEQLSKDLAKQYSDLITMMTAAAERDRAKSQQQY